MDVGPLQDIKLDSDFSWKIKKKFLYFIHLKSKNQFLKKFPLLDKGPLQDSQLDSDYS